MAETFEELADLSELGGRGADEAGALRGVARSVRALGEPVSAVCARGSLGELPFVTTDIAALLLELVQTGAVAQLEGLRAEIPSTLLDVLRVPGIGPKRARSIWKALDVTSLGELAYACRENRVRELPGFGERTQERVLAAVTFLVEGAGHIVLARALEVGTTLCEALRDAGAHAEIAGEARRGVEVVTEVVVVVGGVDVGEAHDVLALHPEVRTVSELSEHGFRVTTRERISARVRVARAGELVAALIVETGDALHVRWLAELARASGQDLAALTRRASSEAAVYRALGVTPVPPELREGAAPSVPSSLINERDLSGVFHVHTQWSDGAGTILGACQAAQRAGFAFVGISDHSKAAGYARGLDERRLADQRGAVAAARRELRGVTLLHGCEVDILADGSLDLDTQALLELDFVIASVHSELHQEADVMTRRLVRAVSNPLVTMLGHPTGRLLLARKGAAFDVRLVAEAAAKNETYLEINGNPNRLDLSDVLIRRAAAAGAEFVINPDAHEPAAIVDARLGVRVARRAGLTASEVLNAREPSAVFARLAARRHRAAHHLA